MLSALYIRHILYIYKLSMSILSLSIYIYLYIEIKMISIHITSPDGVTFATEPMEQYELLEGMGSSAPC